MVNVGEKILYENLYISEMNALLNIQYFVNKIETSDVDPD